MNLTLFEKSEVQYTGYQAKPTCGIATTETLIGAAGIRVISTTPSA